MTDRRSTLSSSSERNNYADTVASPKTLSVLRTVVVDDSAEFLCMLLTLVDDFDVVEVVGVARDGADAVDVVEKLHPDLVIMDVNMPAMNGFCAAATIRARSRSTQVILMSAEDQSASSLSDCGAVAFVSKWELRGNLELAIAKCIQKRGI
jgi:CheY-like chemotaxis protein